MCHLMLSAFHLIQNEYILFLSRLLKGILRAYFDHFIDRVSTEGQKNFFFLK
jgi:hypothetical protein